MRYLVVSVLSLGLSIGVQAEVSLIGKWKGSYVCSSETRTLEADVYENLNAVFRFSGVEDDGKPYEGIFLGRFQQTGNEVILHNAESTVVNWFLRPTNYFSWSAITFSGRIEGSVINGIVLSAGCGDIHLTKVIDGSVPVVTVPDEPKPVPSLSPDFSLSIPYIEYDTAFGVMPLWVNMQYVLEGERVLFEVTGFGEVSEQE